VAPLRAGTPDGSDSCGISANVHSITTWRRVALMTANSRSAATGTKAGMGVHAYQCRELV
jgi:hypothetical protein